MTLEELALDESSIVGRKAAVKLSKKSRIQNHNQNNN
jgi:hypothetical protein